METKSTTISPFIMLLVPALLAMLFTLGQPEESRVQEANTYSFLSVPAFKLLVDTRINCHLW